MADKSSNLVLDALRRATVDPAGVPLFSQKTTQGLFSATKMAKLAAQRCKEENLLRVVRTTARGKAVEEVVTITPKGLDHLLSESNPRQVLEDLVRAIEGRQEQLAEWIAVTRQAQAGLEAMKQFVANVLQRLDAAPISDCTPVVMGYLKDWALAPPPRIAPCLICIARSTSSSIGQFHDLLRRLSAEERIDLHPWTGPLSELPEPPLALLVGHQIAYYASFREVNTSH